MKDEKSASLLLEIGTEEIPARFIPDGVKSLRDALLNFFEDSAIGFGEVWEYATPRRLALLVEDVSEKQKDRTKEIAGPPRKIAFDGKGAPTQAAVGFAKSCGVDVKELKTVRTERGEYLSVTVREAGRETIDVLSSALPKLITSVPFPKSMRWGGGALRFARPIRWIAAMLGAEVIPFELDGLRSGGKSFGHRFISPGPFEIKDPVSYKKLLAENGIIADPEERKGTILGEIKKLSLKRAASSMKTRSF
jgi:glycyl-tRNA synthetase beta chain